MSGWGFETLRAACIESHVADIRIRSADAVFKILNSNQALDKLLTMLVRI